MKVYGYTETKEGMMEIENTLKAMQQFVGGLIDVVGITPNIDLVIDDEGLLDGSTPRVLMLDPPNLIMGNCFVCRHDRAGNFKDIKDEDVPIIRKKLKHIGDFIVVI